MFPNLLFDFPDGTNQQFDRNRFQTLFGYNYITQNQYQNDKDKRHMITTAKVRQCIHQCHCQPVWDDVLMKHRKCFNENDCIRVQLRTECGLECGEACENRPFIDNIFATKSLGLIYKPFVNFGMITNLPIRQGELVIEFVGDVFMKRKYPKGRNPTYSLDIPSSDFSICALNNGNFARFLNHSHNPNLMCYAYYTHDQVRVVLQSTRDIRAGEELTWTYYYDAAIDFCQCGEEQCPNFFRLDAAVAEHYRLRKIQIDNGWITQHHQVELLFPPGHVSDQEQIEEEEEAERREEDDGEDRVVDVIVDVEEDERRAHPNEIQYPINDGAKQRPVVKEIQLNPINSQHTKNVAIKTLSKKRGEFGNQQKKHYARHKYYVVVKEHERTVLMRHVSTQFPEPTIQPNSSGRNAKKQQNKKRLPFHRSQNKSPTYEQTARKRSVYDRAFKSYENYQVAVKSCSKNNPHEYYFCTDCEEKYYDYAKYKRHMRIHTNPDKYKCEQCPMTFTNAGQLESHKLLHDQQ